MFTPRIKSKLSTLAYDSSSLETGEAQSTSSESPEPDIGAYTKAPTPRKPTVSRLSFPFVKSAKAPPPAKAVKPTSPTQPNNSCSPSRPSTSSVPSVKLGAPPPSPTIAPPQPFSYNPHRNPERQNYRHRGYSRHALAHIQWFWVMREEDWETRAGPVRPSKPRLDESFLETALDDPLASVFESTSPKRKVPLHPVHQPQHALPPMTIHPRRGDLTSLRDPYCIEADRSLVTLPTWTIGKTLWMYDVHLASQDRVRNGVEASDVQDLYDDTESESESVAASASSMGYSDDSDTTLVDSETESDLSPGSSGYGIFRDHDLDGKRYPLSHDTFSSSISPSSSGPMRSTSDISLFPPALLGLNWPNSAYSEPSTPPPTPKHGCRKALPRQSSWATDWSRRWQCMIEVSNRGRSSDGKSRFFLSPDADDAIDYFSAPSSSSS